MWDLMPLRWVVVVLDVAEFESRVSKKSKNKQITITFEKEKHEL